ncbi:MAG: glycosyltransferase family 2 protein [Candidatus Hinthialibacter antarcticus]|nr:glycosyltransferase family 2 protein [Candidatus Hinthialibacter antarcticus]
MNAEPLTLVIPAWNEADAIAPVVENVREALSGREIEILVIDDGSNDDTAARAQAAGATVIRQWKQKGYGASLKTGVRQAKHERIAIMDADGQHDPTDIVRLLDELAKGYDSVIGARDRKSFQYASRMPGKAFLQWFAGFLVGETPDDVNSGLRVFKKQDALQYISILPNAFSFTTTLTLAMMKDAYRVGFVSIQTRPRQGRRSSVSLRDGLRTVLLIIRIAALFNPLKVFLPISAVLFLTGLGYGAWNLMREFNIPSGAVLCLTSSVIVFFFGVLADQLASIRRGR